MKQSRLAMLLCLLVSCTQKPIVITDYSFIIKADVMKSGTSCMLAMDLVKGTRDASYRFDYVLDSDPSLFLTDDRGSVLRPGGNIVFSSGKKYLNLPALKRGEHSIDLSISNGEYDFHNNINFSVEEEAFALHAEVKTDMSSSTSTLLLSLAEGVADKDYKGMIYLDGKVMDPEGFAVNFSMTPILSVILPAMRPGSHEIMVTADDGTAKTEVKFLFDEPLRYKDMEVVIDRSPISGKTRFMVRSNPYGLTLALRDSLHISGRCDYHIAHTSMVEHMDDITEYKELDDVVELKTFVPETGVWYNLTDSGRLEKMMTDMTEENTRWFASWDSSGEGGWNYSVIGDGVSHYVIQSSTHFMTVRFETLLGITVHVSNSEKDVVLNGTSITDSYSYTLSDSPKQALQ